MEAHESMEFLFEFGNILVAHARDFHQKRTVQSINAPSGISNTIVMESWDSISIVLESRDSNTATMVLEVSNTITMVMESSITIVLESRDSNTTVMVMRFQYNRNGNADSISMVMEVSNTPTLKRFVQEFESNERTLIEYVHCAAFIVPMGISAARTSQYRVWYS